MGRCPGFSLVGQVWAQSPPEAVTPYCSLKPAASHVYTGLLAPVSFGGFVANWIEGHNKDGLFAALVSHAGDCEQWSAYGSTEELWFPEWEMFGPPWEHPKLHDRLSPIRYAKSFKTPMLITHGDLDYRVPVTQSEQMFTALQRLGVPSKMIRFPDEGHWILRPANQVFWYRSILEWFDRWLKPPESEEGGLSGHPAAQAR